jgi:hypothetical protein
MKNFKAAAGLSEQASAHTSPGCFACFGGRKAVTI